MGLFSTSGPSLKEIDNFTIQKINDYLGQANQIQDGKLTENYDAMLLELRVYADRHDLSVWIRTRITGNIEMILRRYFPKDAASILWKKAMNVICPKH